MTDTPNDRLARVLRLLADVAEKNLVASRQKLARTVSSLWFDDEDNFVDINGVESDATEAARLAGVPLDGWYTSEPKYGEQYILTIKNGDIVIAMFDRYQWWAGEDQQYRLDDVLAWRPLPEPYRPAEVKS